MLRTAVADAENESDSDVSIYANESPLDGMRGGPLAPAPANPMTREAIEERLSQLSELEKLNASRHDVLVGKRARKDARLQQRRVEEDKLIESVYAARARKDERIQARRIPIDQGYDAVERMMFDEETALRWKLKQLKKGKSLDEPPMMNRGISSLSMSPPAPQSSYQSPAPSASYHSSMPPAKRHQAGHPSQIMPQRPASQSQTPSYRFVQPNEAANGYVAPMPSSVQAASPHTSPHASQPMLAPQRSLGYDTLPPPPTSGFAPINPPQTSGFAPINQASASVSTPTPVQNGESTPLQYSRKDPADRTDTPASGTGASGTGPGSSKRTPSSTHPYTQSEAFNNRHHKCERTDVLNRGIWTSYGPGGTEDHPTGPPMEMYLRCSHGSCRRIDWRTVHGLQCHIVKLHEIPKGTIGSLEKALDAYGVPISEVEEHEKVHGLGSGGDMADPKNAKLKKMTAKSVPALTQQGSGYSMQVPEDSPASTPDPLAPVDLPTRNQQEDTIMTEDDVKPSPARKQEEPESLPVAPPTSGATPPVNHESWMGPKEPEATAAFQPVNTLVKAPKQMENTSSSDDPIVVADDAATTTTAEVTSAGKAPMPAPTPASAPHTTAVSSASTSPIISRRSITSQARDELQHRRDSDKSDDDSTTVDQTKAPSPLKRNTKGRFQKKMSFSKSPATTRNSKKNSEF